jgi:hypothetical protein
VDHALTDTFRGGNGDNDNKEKVGANISNKRFQMGRQGAARA